MILPLGFAKDTRAALISGGHGILHTRDLPPSHNGKRAPSTPVADAFTYPASEGHMRTSSFTFVGCSVVVSNNAWRSTKFSRISKRLPTPTTSGAQVKIYLGGKQSQAWWEDGGKVAEAT